MPAPQPTHASGSPEINRQPPGATTVAWPHQGGWLAWGPAILGAGATLAVLLTLAPELGGPGITCDEPYQVAYGKGLVWAWRQQGLGFFQPQNIARNFGWKPGGPPVHPPLGNWVLGWTHHLFDTAPNNPAAISIVGARFAPALAFGLLVWLVGVWTARMEGPLAGTAAAASVALVPRLFAHAHLAALDMFTALSVTAAAAAVARAEAGPTRWWRFALAGAVWGLAMLVRLHGVLIAVPVVAWLVWRLRRRVVLPLACWLAAGVATLYAAWPWLWLAPWDNLRQYLASGSQRQSIHVFYWAQVWSDRQVPRHYAPLVFLVAMPAGLFLLGIVGWWARRRVAHAPAGIVLAAAMGLSLLLVFCLPGIPVYDGERLFLPVLALWAIGVGIGARWLVEHPRLQARRRLVALAIALGIALQGSGIVVYHPCQLSHYSLLAGGLRGAERLGFEVDYWGAGVTEPLLAEGARLAAGGKLLLVPSLAPYQAPGIQITSASLTDRQVTLVGWNRWRAEEALGIRYGIVYRRKADLSEVPEEILHGRVVAEVARQGVWIARLVEFTQPIGVAEIARWRQPAQGGPPP